MLFVIVILQLQVDKVMGKIEILPTISGNILKALNEGEKDLIKEVIVEKLVEVPVDRIVEVPVEVIVEKEKIVEVPVEVVIEKEIIKEIPVEKVVTKVEYISDKTKRVLHAIHHDDRHLDDSRPHDHDGIDCGA